MKSVVFARDYEHRLNAHQVAVYRAGRRYAVSADVLEGAKVKGALKEPRRRKAAEA